MSEIKTIATIGIVTDSETSYDKIGDVQGGFNEIQLKEHIKKHGHIGLLETLAYMQWEVWQTVREINQEEDIIKHKPAITDDLPRL